MTRLSDKALANYMSADLPPPSARWQGFPAYNFVGGHNAPESIPTDLLRQATDRVLQREGHTLAFYGLESGPQGYKPLREFLAKKLHKYSAIRCTADDILITSGSLQAMDLINMAFLKPGDVVVAEESNYGGVKTRLARLGVEVVTVPLDDQGMQTDQLEKVLEKLSADGRTPRYIYTIPTIHNPTGSILSLTRRHHLLQLAETFDTIIFEDECYADLIWDQQRPPSLRGLDKSGRVVYIGTFSKTIAPAFRVGYMVADPAILAQILSLKTDAGSGALEQMVLAEFCQEHFDDHLLKLNGLLKRKLDHLTATLDEYFGTAIEYCYPPGGIFLWVKFPKAVDTTKLDAIAQADGIAVNPGKGWSWGHDASQYIRLCFASPDEQTIREGISRLAQLCQEEFQIPEVSANTSITQQ